MIHIFVTIDHYGNLIGRWAIGPGVRGQVLQPCFTSPHPELLDPFLHLIQSPAEIVEIAVGTPRARLADRLAGSEEGPHLCQQGTSPFRLLEDQEEELHGMNLEHAEDVEQLMELEIEPADEKPAHVESM